MDRSLDSASLTSIDTIPSPKIQPNKKPQQKPEQNSTELELDVVVLKEPSKKEENEESYNNTQWVKISKKIVQFLEIF